MRSAGKPIDPEALFRHTDWMRALARSLVADEDRADDVIQDAWLAAMRMPPTRRATAGAWLKKVLRNFAYRFNQQEHVRRRHELAAGRRVKAVPTPEQVLQRAELHRMVVDAVIQLDEPFRSTVLLRFFEGITTSEIASQYRIDVSTVRWRLRKALRQLRGRLDQAHRGDRQAWAVPALALSGGPTADVAIGSAVTANLSSATIESGLSGLAGGGVVMGKTTAVVLGAVVVLFSLGIGIGRLTAPTSARQSSAGPDVVPRQELDEVQARYETAARQIESLRKHATSVRTRLTRELASVREELTGAKRRIVEMEASKDADPPGLVRALGHLTELGIRNDDLWKLLEGRGDLSAMKKLVEAIECYCLAQLARDDLTPDEREQYEKMLEVNGFRRGYTYTALGDFRKARQAFLDHIEALNAKEAAGQALDSASNVYRMRSQYHMKFLEGFAGKPAPAELDLEGSWVTPKKVSIAESNGKVLALLFRRVNDKRSQDFLRSTSEFCSGEPGIEMATVSFLKPDVSREAQMDALRSELSALGYEGAAGFDPDADTWSLFRKYGASVGSATFVIINQRGEPIWCMQDPHSARLGVATTLLERAAKR